VRRSWPSTRCTPLELEHQINDSGAEMIVIFNGSTPTLIDGELHHLFLDRHDQLADNRPARHKAPKNARFVEALAKSTVGKILRRELHDLA
jgi:acyl-coenzyme A synthetase/AMP-(fatty) acid ligase